MEQSHSWEADSRLAGQENPGNLKVHYRVHKNIASNFYYESLEPSQHHYILFI
jgi:hypothetical protein